MIQMLRKRLNREEEGFTLIELMVVVLIIAILLAIAIPTFLGARTRAQNRAAESNLNTALTAEKTAYTDNQSYVSDTAAMSSIEPSLAWTTSAPGKGTNAVALSTGDSGNEVCLWAQSGSGNYYGIVDIETVDTTFPSGDQGTFYYSNTSGANCPSASFTANATSSGLYTTTSGASW